MTARQRFTALCLISLVLIAQAACWARVVSSDATPLVGDSGELYRRGLLTLHRLADPEGRPVPPLMGQVIGLWLRLTGPGRLSVALFSLLVYLGMVVVSWQLASRIADDPAAGFLAGACCASLPGMIGPARYLIPDFPAGLIVGLIWVLLLASRGAGRWGPMICGGLLAGAAMLCKVSMAVYLLPLAGWVGWQLYRDRANRGRLVLALALTLAVALPWYVRETGAAASYYLADPASSGSATWGMRRHSAEYLLYYPLVLWHELTGPLLGTVLAIGLLAAIRQRTSWSWIAYAVTVIVGFSLCPFRVPRYLFGLLPLLAALAGIGLAGLLRHGVACLALGSAVAAAGLGWSILQVVAPQFSSFPPLAYHATDNLHGEDLAGIGLFRPTTGSWGGDELAQLVRAHSESHEVLLVVGTRQFAAWDLRLALLERGVDQALEIPRQWPAGDLSLVLPTVKLVLLSDYSVFERDFRRRNIWPTEPEEYSRRGYRIEVEAEKWFARSRSEFRMLSRRLTPDGKHITLFVRK